MKLKRLITTFTIFNCFLAIIPLLFNLFYKDQGVLIPYFWLLFGFFSFFSLIICLFSLWRMKLGNKSSGQAILSSVTIRFLIFMVVSFIYLSQINVNPKLFLLCFFYIYFFQTAFEIYFMLCNLRIQNKK